MTSRPSVGVGAIAVSNDSLLMVRRGHGPAAGEWSIPGGHVEQGEMATEAVLRELAEETGYIGICGQFVGWVERISDDAHHVILDFDVVILDTDADPVAGSDAAEARWIPLVDVAEQNLVDGLAEFLHDHGYIDTIV